MKPIAACLPTCCMLTQSTTGANAPPLPKCWQLLVRRHVPPRCIYAIIRISRPFDVSAGTYGAAKLANVVFAHELHRRSGGRIAACAADPGGVATGIFRHMAWTRTAGAWFMNAFLATPAEGCQAVVHAATAPWPDARPVGRCEATARHNGGRVRRRSHTDDGGTGAARGCAPYFARGMFASPPVAAVGAVKGLRECMARVVAPVCAALDHPLRLLLRGRCGTARVRAVGHNVAACDELVGAALWRESCVRLGLSETLQT